MRKSGLKDRTNSQEKLENKFKIRSARSNESVEESEEISSPKARTRSGNIRNKLIHAESIDTMEENVPNNILMNDFETEASISNDNSYNSKRKLDTPDTEGKANECQSSLKKTKPAEDQLETDETNKELPKGTVKVENGPEEHTEKEKENGIENELIEKQTADNAKEESCEENHTEYDEMENISERRERRKAKSKYSNMDNDDLEKMLKWKNGVGHLPGSNLKFCKSSTGALDLITPSDDEEENPQNGENSAEKKTRRKRGIKKQEDAVNAETNTPKFKKSDMPDLEKKKRKERKKKKFAEDELLKCETCGCFGLISEFRSSGRFCSQRCVGAYASKRRAEMIAEQFASGERPLPKSGRKPMKKRKSGAKDTNIRSPMTDKTFFAISDNDQKISDDSTLYYETVGHDVEFDWETYLRVTGTGPASCASIVKEYPELDFFPVHAIYFKPTMKLECIDPKHQSHICVVSVVEVQGARMRLHFDGWSESYDFWINCDSSFLHPCGWCEKNGQKLNPPKGFINEEFNWFDYLEKTGCEAAPAHFFHDPSPTLHGFTKTMKLEAVDRKNPDLICVSSVNNVIGNHFLIHFDEWDDQYDYWCKDDSPFIHPVGWCMENQVPLVPPTDEMVNKFVWEDYLRQTNTIAAPKHIFKQREEKPFEAGTKLEVVDPRNPSLVRVATVSEVEEYRVKIHFDGWSEVYDYWFDFDSTDLHPVFWCVKTGHLLEAPPVGREFEQERLCGTPGCRGIGHIKGLKYTTHHTSFGCPYTQQNLNRSTSPVVDRLAPNAMTEETSICNRIHVKKQNSPASDVFPDSTTKEESKKPQYGRLAGRPLKKRHRLSDSPQSHGPNKTGVKRKKRRGSDEVSSSTSPSTHHTHDTKYVRKPISSTHVPAGQSMRLQGKTVSNTAIPWSQDDVVEFLTRIGYEELAPSFTDNQIDGQALLLLSQADLVHHLKLKLGPALKIYSEISKL